ncbi:MAG TPA: hypothetical protein GXZ76_01330 [Clostridiaceae bacterium]|nr:hypothetical protein [Clostridiaceae bacterium]
MLQNKQISKILKIIVPVILILAAIILLFIYPGFLLDSYGVEPLANRYYSIWDAKGIIEKLKPVDREVEQAFRENFIVDFDLQDSKKSFQGIVTSVELAKNDEIIQETTFNLTDQLLWGKYLALAGEPKEFKVWQDMIAKLYLNDQTWATQINRNGEILAQTEITWTYDLQYADVLLTAYNRNPGRSLKQHLEQIMERAWPYFSADKLTPNYQSEIERIFYPETSSTDKPTENPELINPYQDANIIRLSDINLYVLESFSLIDQKWQQPYEHWSKLIIDSIDSESVFYPFGIMPDEQNYVPTMETAFATETLDTIKIVYQLKSKQQNSNTEGFVNRQLIQTNNLYKTYNIVTGQNMSEQTDIQAMALFADHVVKYSSDSNEYTNSEVLASISAGLSTKQYKEKLSPLNKLFYESIDAKRLFNATDQLYVLISGIIK